MALKRGDILAVTLEAAMGADLTANPATWTWTDLSSRLKGSANQGNPATITRGRMDEAQQTQPSRLTIRLENTDGWLTPRHPSSQWYLQWKRGTPVRLKVTIPGDATYTRFQGRITAIQPIWPSGNSQVAFVDITAQGAIYNLQQGPLLESAMFQTMAGASIQPSAYWPLEDGSDGLVVTQGANAISGGSPMLSNGASNFAATTGAPGSDRQPTFSAGGSLSGNVPAASVTQWRIQCLARFNTINTGDFAVPLEWNTADGTGWELLAHAVADGGLGYSDTNINSFSSNAKIDDGLWHELRATATQSGGNIILNVRLDGALVINQTFAGTVTAITQVFSNRGGSVSNVIAGVGHFMVWNGTTSIPGLDTVDAMRGHLGETATARITRLCAEQDVPVTVTGTSATTMGPQGVNTLINLLRECEAADLGILTDGLDAGLRYLSREARYNQAVTLALDANLGQVKWPPFDPLEDDQRLRTTFTASRVNGSSATFTDPSATTEGTYAGQATLNVAEDATLTNQASFRSHLSTVPEMRAPAVAIDVRNSPELIAQWLATDTGERYTVANPPVQYPPGGLDLVLEQYVETIDGITWRVQLTGSPYAPWKVFVLDTDRLDALNSTLISGVSAGATSLSVATTAGYPLWTTNAADFVPPFDIDVGGRQVTVTNITAWLNANPFFETDTSDWAAGSGATIARSTAQAHEGSASMLLTPPGAVASIDAHVVTKDGVAPNTNYTASGWVFMPNAWTDVRTCIDWYDSSNTFISSSLGSASSVGANTWTFLSQTLTSPSNAAFAVLRARVGGTPGATITSFWDELKLTEPNTQGFTIQPAPAALPTNAVVQLWRPPVVAL